jgi:uncharacterized protein (DUF302 family)
MPENFAFRLETNKPFDTVVENIEKQTAEHKFRVLAVHNVKETLAEKGFERKPLKIIEVCNAGFAHQALQKDIDVALFMPCRFAVYTKGDKTIVSLNRPSVISQMLPDAGLDELAGGVEETLKQVMQKSV